MILTKRLRRYENLYHLKSSLLASRIYHNLTTNDMEREKNKKMARDVLRLASIRLRLLQRINKKRSTL